MTDIVSPSDASPPFHPDQPTRSPQATAAAAGRGFVSPNHTHLALASHLRHGVVGGQTVKDDPPRVRPQATVIAVGRPDVHNQPGPERAYPTSDMTEEKKT